VHARKAWLKGLSPKQNRELPPLNYARVWALKAAHPELEIIINGGITTLAAAAAQLALVDGVAMGRSAYQNPYLLADVDRQLFGAASAPPSRRTVLETLIPYVEEHLARGGRLNNIARHILGLYRGQHHARAFRRHLAQNAPRPGAGVEVLRESIVLIEEGHRARLGAAAWPPAPVGASVKEPAIG
jgi:tRNA-dihydrouridine synthase A